MASARPEIRRAPLLADELAFLLHAFGLDDPDRRDGPIESLASYARSARTPSPTSLPKPEPRAHCCRCCSC